MARRLLITGFDPFGGADLNPAWEAVKLLPEKIGDFEVHKLEIPTVFGEAANRVARSAEEVQPHVILCVGQGAWEEDGVRSLKYLESVFREKGIHAWCDFWGYDVNHDWPWWFRQMRYFLPKMIEG